MKLDNKNKEIIDQYFEMHSEEEVKEAFKKLGLEFNGKEKSYDDLTTQEAFQKLLKEMQEYVNYLREETYHPYEKVEYFISVLDKLIDRLWPKSFNF